MGYWTHYDVYQPTAVSVTHGFTTHTHFDHIKGLETVLKCNNVPVVLSNKTLNALQPATAQQQLTAHQDTLWLGDELIGVFHTPGHTQGCQSYYHPNYLFTGDTLFYDRVGRCDLKESDPLALYESLQTIKQFPAETIVYPGHVYHQHQPCTLADLQKTNRYFKETNQERFLKRVSLLY